MFLNGFLSTDRLKKWLRERASQQVSPTTSVMGTSSPLRLHPTLLRGSFSTKRTTPAPLLPLLGFGGFFALGSYLWYLFFKVKNERLAKLKEVKTTGTAKLGGPFSLVDHTGRPVTSADFKGRWSLVYFGFTFCPDICPYELRKMKLALDKIEKEFGPNQIVPIFVTLDPWRDSVEQLAAFVQEPEYPKNLVGLTGTPEQIDRIARAFRVYFMKNAGDDKSEDEDYLVDHSIFMYLMDRDWKFAEFYGVQLDSSEIAADLRKKLNMERGITDSEGFFDKWLSMLKSK